MKRWVIMIAIVAFILAAATATRSVAGGPKDGKAIFVENKCQSCHSIKSQGLEKKQAPTDEAAPAEGARKPPDLSDAGNAHDAAWMAKFLMKLESTKKGDKHKRKFKSSEADLKTLTVWLETLKQEKKEK